MMGGIKKFQAVLATVLACLGMWGCSEDKVRWHEGFTGARIVGFVNDSLVMVGSYQQRTESHEGTFEPYWDVIEAGHERLCVYNYRVQENGPRWCDTLGEYNTTNAFRGQMTDSIVWGGDMPNSIRLWKVGETQHQIKLEQKFEGCSKEFEITSVKQWLDGTFIVRGDKSLTVGGDSCQYAVLDTVEKVLTYKRLDKNLEWIRKCDDVRVRGMDVHCLVLDRMTYDAYLVVNETIKYSMMRDVFKLGNYAVVSFLGDYISLHRTLYKYENNEVCRMTGYSEFGISFGDGNGNYIVYDN